MNAVSLVPGSLTFLLAQRADPWDRCLRIYEVTQDTKRHQSGRQAWTLTLGGGLQRLRISQGLPLPGLKSDKAVCLLTSLTKSSHLSSSQAQFLGHSGVSCSYFRTESQERMVIDLQWGQRCYIPQGLQERNRFCAKYLCPGNTDVISQHFIKLNKIIIPFTEYQTLSLPLPFLTLTLTPERQARNVSHLADEK